MPDTPEEKFNSLEEGTQPSDQLRQIRTYQGDVASALERQNESLVSIQQAEAARRRAVGDAIHSQTEKDGKRKDVLYLLFGSIFLIAVGLVGAWYGYQELVRRSAPPVLVTPATQFISPNSEAILDMSGKSRESFSSAFASLTEGLSERELKHIDLRNGADSLASTTETAQFLNTLESEAPGSLIRAFSPLFMLGGLGSEQFLIIKLASFDNAFAGMLQWESSLAEDLIPVFANANALQVNEGVNVFKDVIIKNKDVRVLEAAGEPALLYTFFDNNMLIITESVENLETLMERLTREKLSR